METWEETLRNHERDDAEFMLRKSYDQYVCMVANSRSSREQQTCEKDKQDIVRYHSISYETFADHFIKPHRPTREIRNIEKNDAIESMYSQHLTLMQKCLKDGKESDIETYNSLAKTLKILNDVSVSPRFLSFHTVRKNIHK